MTDDELRDLVASIAVVQKKISLVQKETSEQMKRTDEQMKRTDEQMKRTDEQMKRTDEQMKRIQKEASLAQKEASLAQKEASLAQKETSEQMKLTDEQLKRTDEKLERIGIRLGNISNNQGDVAEEFFYNSLIKNNRLGNISFDDITKNMEKHRGNLQEEYDLFMTNGDSIAIVEVKYKAHIKDLDKLERKFNNFKKLFPIYKDYKLYGAMAAFHMNDDAKEEALNRGYFTLQRTGEVVSCENSSYLKVA